MKHPMYNPNSAKDNDEYEFFKYLEKRDSRMRDHQHYNKVKLKEHPAIIALLVIAFIFFVVAMISQ